MIWEVRVTKSNEDEKLADKFARRETPARRAVRINGKKVDPATLAAVRAAFGIK